MTQEKQLDLFEGEITKDSFMTDEELSHKLRDALTEIYVMYMHPNDFNPNEELDMLSMVKEALDEYAKVHR